MAIQNFLSGGFYGKLGDVVGQRWRNKRTVRSHVIPFNPRTEKQQSNRQLFAMATSLAQQAFNINKGWEEWQRPDMGQFSWMVGTAKLRLQAGATPAEALPLHPDGFDPTVTIRNATPNWADWGSTFALIDTTYILPENRQVEVIFNCYDMYSNQWILFKEHQTLLANEPFTITLDTNNRYALPDGSSVQALTTDDADHAMISISLPVFNLSQPSKPTFSYDIEDWIIDDSDYDDTMYFNADHPYNLLFDDMTTTIRCRSLSNSQWVNVPVDVIFENEHTAHINIFVNELYDFPVGSSINEAIKTFTEYPQANITMIINPFPFSYP